MNNSSTRPPGRPPKDRLLGLPELRSLVPLSKSKLYDLIARSRFPRPVKVDRSAFWRLSEVEAWMASLDAIEFPAAAHRPEAQHAHEREHI
jgi:predicted DNA-binding transcriptional regulator AlpA